jgi:hypothetical protein
MADGGAGGDAMNRDPLFRVFHALASKRFPGLGADDLRDARLGWLSLLLGRTVTSSKTLDQAELKRAVDQLMKEVPAAIAQKYRRAAGGYRPRRQPTADGLQPNLVMMPSRAAITDEQLRFIAQLEQLLGWAGVPERLGAFLQQWYGVRDARALDFGKAGRLVESLSAVAARARVKARLGQDHPVSRQEITAQVQAVKDELHAWSRPDPEGA